MKWRVVNKNIKDWSSDELFDGVLCDPPYELGFMGKSWDSSGIAYDVEMWRNIFDHLKPGAHLLAFSGSRTYHRMACAIEDAGFEIRDMIEWVYGSGFPKSLHIGKAVDKIQGNEREELGFREDFVKRVRKNGVESKDYIMAGGWKADPTQVGRLTKGTSPFEGYGTALKPAHEPCVLARKPLEKGMTVATNALKHGTGGLNIDGTRIEAEPELAKNWNRVQSANQGIASTGIKQIDLRDRVPTGRFPANLIHDGSDEVVGLFPDTKSGAMNSIAKPNQYNTYGKMYERVVTNPASQGSAARFFYTAKASKSERNAGLEGFEEQITNDGRKTDIDNAFQRGITERKNHHPTVKPLSLTKYLATLIKPPTGGRLLVPFSGSGSEMIGALQAGWEYVEGIELTEEYIPIAEARIKYWTKQPVQEELL